MPPIARRLTNQPIIYPDMDDRMGSNINGPSLIRVPDWINKPLGRYYLYFADHKGKYIRMAFADSVMGPWTIYTPGVMDVAESLFQPVDLQQAPVSETNDRIQDVFGGYTYAHIASPDVHVDAVTKQLRMYYHGLLPDGDQMTRVAYSTDGLSFAPEAPLLGPPYFRAISHDGRIYVISWGGQFLRSSSWDGPFEAGPILSGIGNPGQPDRILRHAALIIRNEMLHVFYSCIGDRPESILHTELPLSENWDTWTAQPEIMLLEPSLEWEGGELSLEKSEVGAAEKTVRELRDPCIYEEDGRTYLLYSGAGEAGIGLAEIVW